MSSISISYRTCVIQASHARKGEVIEYNNSIWIVSELYPQSKRVKINWLGFGAKPLFGEEYLETTANILKIENIPFPVLQSVAAFNGLAIRFLETEIELIEGQPIGRSTDLQQIKTWIYSATN